jgi:hypothetical protein
MTEQEKTARRTLSRCTVSQLAKLWEETNNNTTSKDIWTVRGWIMDALQAKNPQAFDKWIDSDSDSPLQYYATA